MILIWTPMTQIRLPLYLLLLSVLLLITAVPVQADGTLRNQPWIRVALANGMQSVTVTASGPSRINYLESSETIESYENSHTYRFDPDGSYVSLSGTSCSGQDGYSIICMDDSDSLKYNDQSYRHMIRVVAFNGGLSVINMTPMEEYLYGVVPGEVPHTWPTATLRAQAIAARTYAYRCLGQYPNRPFDVYSTVMDQVFGGIESERESTTQACRDTFGEICCFDGQPIYAYYHAASGGWTALGEDVFGRDLPYLKPVPSRDSSIYRWTCRVSANELASALRNIGFQVGSIQRVWVHYFSPDGRADKVKVVHSSGVTIVTGRELRRALGASNIKSMYFTVEGQTAPDIPDGNSYQPVEIPVVAGDSLDRYSSVNPGVCIPVPVAIPLNECRVLSSDGIHDADRITVLGADESREYTGGYIWRVEPVRARNLDEDWIENFFSLTSSVIEPSDTGELIDDPGSGVGISQDGNFTFIGHGYGHGVGMSQYGARELAENGWNHHNILKYFYTGIEIERLW